MMLDRATAFHGQPIFPLIFVVRVVVALRPWVWMVPMGLDVAVPVSELPRGDLPRELTNLEQSRVLC